MHKFVRRLFWPVLVHAVALGVAGPAGAKPVDMVHDASGKTTVQISFPKGKLDVVPSSDKRVHVTGTVSDDIERVYFQQDGDVLAVRFSPDKPKDNFEAKLTVALPGGVSFSGNTVSANIDLRGALRRVQLNSVSGRVVAAGSAAELSVNTVSGGVTLSTRCPRTEVNTVSGNVTLRSVEKELSVTTVSGKSEVASPALSKLEMSTVSGDIDVDAPLVGGGPFSLSTQAADVTLTVQPGARLKIDTSTFSGRVQQQVGSFDDGVPVNISTFAGNITIREKGR